MPMDSKQIEDLLAKYWNCETSVEEERALREYFSGGAQNGSMKELAAMFQYLNKHLSKEASDPAWDGRMRELIRAKQARLRRLLRFSNSIAAGVVVMMAAVLFVRSKIRESTPHELVD